MRRLYATSCDTDHRYHYARCGRSMHDTEVTSEAGGFSDTRFAEEPEPHYSGGMALAPQDPSVLYLSRQSADGFVIERWSTKDRGLTWTSRPVETAQDGLNVRPVVPHGASGSPDQVLWMNGRYIHFTDYHTEIRMALPAMQ